MWKAGFRGILADYAYVVCLPLIRPSKPAPASSLLLLTGYQFCTLFWVGFSHIPGTIKSARMARVPITEAFKPTQPRSWLIDFWRLDVKWVFVAMPFGFLVMLLFYYDHVRYGADLLCG